MQSLKQQITMLVVVTILILAVSFMVAIGLQIKKTAVLASVTKAKSDLATGEAILDLKYPGPWRVVDNILYKGNIKITNNFEPVDYISSLTGDTCTIFLGNTRVATTIINDNGERAVGTHSSDEVAKRVLTDGREYLGEAEVLGEKYQTAYKPLYDDKGNIIGMFYVGTSKKFYDDMFYGSLLSMTVIGLVLTTLVLAGTWCFTQRVIIEPIKLLTAETQKVASGDLSTPVEIESKNEIGELAQSFNQMVEWLQALTYQISKATGTAVPPGKCYFSGPETCDKTGIISEHGNSFSKVPGKDKEWWGELPKGLNEVTLQQILIFLKNKDRSLSASEIAEEIKLTKVTVRRYLDFMERCGRVKVDMQYGPIGRPLKLYKLME